MPDFSNYLLSTGEKYLSTNYKFFGKDLSSFITYSAITNQFLNCNFKGYTSKYPIGFREGEFQLTLDFFFENHYLNEDKFIVYRNSSDMYKYLEFKNDLFDNYKPFIIGSNKQRDYLKKGKSRKFEIHLLGFVYRKFHPEFNNNFLKDGELFDYECSRGDYFRSCIAVVDEINLEEINVDGEFIMRVKAFKSLSYFRKKLLDSRQSYTSSTRGEFEYIFNKPNDSFIPSVEESRFNEMIDYLINRDYFISSSIFEYKQRFKNTFSLSQKIKSFYSKLIEDFLEVEDDRLPTGRPRPKIKIINLIKELSNSNDAIDLISHADYDFSEEFWNNNTYDVLEGKLVKKQMS